MNEIYEKQIVNCINKLKPQIFLNLSEFDRRKVMTNVDLLNNDIKTFSILYDLIPVEKS